MVQQGVEGKRFPSEKFLPLYYSTLRLQYGGWRSLKDIKTLANIIDHSSHLLSNHRKRTYKTILKPRIIYTNLATAMNNEYDGVIQK